MLTHIIHTPYTFTHKHLLITVCNGDKNKMGLMLGWAGTSIRHQMRTFHTLKVADPLCGVRLPHLLSVPPSLPHLPLLIPTPPTLSVGGASVKLLPSAAVPERRAWFEGPPGASWGTRSQREPWTRAHRYPPLSTSISSGKEWEKFHFYQE
jgi:hypothetical protein